MTEAELWTKNQEDHAAIRRDIQEIKQAVAGLNGQSAVLLPLLKWVVFPLILVVGGPAGAAQLINKLAG